MGPVAAVAEPAAVRTLSHRSRTRTGLVELVAVVVLAERQEPAAVPVPLAVAHSESSSLDLHPK
jgi:hypothetical protein